MLRIASPQSIETVAPVPFNSDYERSRLSGNRRERPVRPINSQTLRVAFAILFIALLLFRANARVYASGCKLKILS
jgi:hypothetical protein